MINQVILVGRITDDFKMNETKNGSQYASNTLAVDRDYKSETGEFETDFIPFKVFGTMATAACEYCKKGDVLGIKGSLSSNKNELFLRAKRVSFISSKSKKDDLVEEKDIKI